MSEHPQPGDLIDRDALVNLRTGVIVKRENDTFPVTAMGEDDFHRFHLSSTGEHARLEDLAPGRYLVLYVPQPDLPRVGDLLTEETIKVLPLYSVIIDEDEDLWQLIEWAGDKEWMPPGSDCPASPKTIIKFGAGARLLHLGTTGE